MEYVHLGRSGLKVSRLCLGTMNFGPQTPEEEAFRIMDRALEFGINFFDTANVYGGITGGTRKGWTEEIIGRWFAQGGGRREKVVIATKLYGDMSSWPNDSRLSALNIRRACEASLKRMQTDYIDLYQMHHVWREVTWDEVWQAMEQLVTQGKIIYNGSSNFAGWHLAQASEAARRRNYLGLISDQSLYNLTARTVELEVLPACKYYGLGFIPWSPLAGGLLGGVLKKQKEGRSAMALNQKRLEKERPQVEKYEALCDEIGEHPADVALAWLLSNEVVTAPIIGPRTMQQLETAMRALEIKLSAEILQKLDEIFPGPGGPAPEAYAVKNCVKHPKLKGKACQYYSQNNIIFRKVLTFA